MNIFEPTSGSNISETCATLEKMVAEHGESAQAEFNGVTIIADEGMTAGDLEQHWREEMEKRAAAYRASPEYKAQQEESRQRSESRKAALQSALAAADPMEFSDAEAWHEFTKNNTDPYGGRVVRYAEEWARLMQARISAGETIQQCADELSSLADDDGITGFMYGCAVATLAKTWKHGEDLRRWHNLDTQIGTEGEANESGGVLNPAILNIGETDE